MATTPSWANSPRGWYFTILLLVFYPLLCLYLKLYPPNTLCEFISHMMSLDFQSWEFYESPNSTVCPFVVPKAICLLATLVLPCSRHSWITCLTILKLPIPSITLECSWSSSQIQLWNLLPWVDHEILYLCEDPSFQSSTLFSLVYLEWRS
jgi:hypothetical protein